MHNFSDLTYRCTVFTLDSLKDVEEKTIEALQTSGATSLVKTLQMARLERTILAVGMFSILEAPVPAGFSQQQTLQIKTLYVKPFCIGWPILFSFVI